MAAKKNQPRSPGSVQDFGDRSAWPLDSDAMDPERLLALGLIDEGRVDGLKK